MPGHQTEIVQGIAWGKCWSHEFLMGQNVSADGNFKGYHVSVKARATHLLRNQAPFMVVGAPPNLVSYYGNLLVPTMILLYPRKKGHAWECTGSCSC